MIRELIMEAVMQWLARSRLRARPESERNTLVQPVATLVIGVVTVAFFFGLALASSTFANNPTATVWTTSIFVGFGLASLGMIAVYYFARHSVSEQGMAYGRMLGQRGEFLWQDVREARYIPFMKWFLLTLHDGTRVRVSAMLIGLPEFAQFVLDHVPSEAIDPATLPILQDAAEGKLPSVWH